MNVRSCQRVGCTESGGRLLHVEVVLDDGKHRASSRRFVCSVDCADQVYDETASRYAERAGGGVGAAGE